MSWFQKSKLCMHIATGAAAENQPEKIRWWANFFYLRGFLASQIFFGGFSAAPNFSSIKGERGPDFNNTLQFSPRNCRVRDAMFQLKCTPLLVCVLHQNILRCDDSKTWCVLSKCATDFLVMISNIRQFINNMLLLAFDKWAPTSSSATPLNARHVYYSRWCGHDWSLTL